MSIGHQYHFSVLIQLQRYKLQNIFDLKNLKSSINIMLFSHSSPSSLNVFMGNAESQMSKFKYLSATCQSFIKSFAKILPFQCFTPFYSCHQNAPLRKFELSRWLPCCDTRRLCERRCGYHYTTGCLVQEIQVTRANVVQSRDRSREVFP